MKGQLKKLVKCGFFAYCSSCLIAGSCCPQFGSRTTMRWNILVNSHRLSKWSIHSNSNILLTLKEVAFPTSAPYKVTTAAKREPNWGASKRIIAMNGLLFFATFFWICKKNYYLLGSFFFFFQCDFANFLFKTKSRQWV